MQTPTLAILVRREQAIRAFLPRDYWEVRGTFATAVASAAGADTFVGAVDRAARRAEAQRQPFRRARARRAGRGARSRARGDDPPGGSDRRARDAKDLARAAAAAVRSHVAAAHGQPPLRSQRVAHARGGAGALRAPQDPDLSAHRLAPPAATIWRASCPSCSRAWRSSRSTRRSRSRCWPAAPARSRRVFDDTKVHDHHAIIPTGKAVDLDALSSDERRIFDLVARRFLGAFHPDAEFAHTEAGSCAWASRAARVPAPGTSDRGRRRSSPRCRRRRIASRRADGLHWSRAGKRSPASMTRRAAPARATRRRSPSADDQARLPPLVGGPAAGRRDSKSLDRQTRPPPRHTEATLLGGHGVGRPRDRGRGAARRHEGHRPGHAGDARGDDRDIAQAQVHRARRQAAGRDTDGDGAHRARSRFRRWRRPSSPAPGRRGWPASRAARRRAPRSWPTSRATCAR